MVMTGDGGKGSLKLPLAPAMDLYYIQWNRLRPFPRACYKASPEHKKVLPGEGMRASRLKLEVTGRERKFPPLLANTPQEPLPVCPVVPPSLEKGKWGQLPWKLRCRH